MESAPVSQPGKPSSCGRPDTACLACGATEARPVFAKQGYRLVECAHCGLAYIANPPTPDELARIYSAASDYHADLMLPCSAEYLRMGRVADHHLHRLLALTGTHGKGARLLDAGCSAGLFLDRARAKGFDVEGVEFSADSSAFARSHFGLKVRTGTLHDLPVEAGSFEILTMFDVLEHVPDPAADIAAAHRLLRPGGLFLLSTPNIDGLFPRLSRPLARLIGYWPHPEPPYHLTQFSVRTLANMLRAGGFRPGRVFHERMPLAYSFGTWKSFCKSPKMAAYAALFAPFAWAGSWLRQGDAFYIAAWRDGA